MRNPLDFLLNEFGRAVADARSHVVEEAWFGRPNATPNHTQSFVEQWLGKEPSQVDRDYQRRPSFDDLWEPRERNHAPETPGGHDIER